MNKRNIALDGMIAEEVMGWSVVPAGGPDWLDEAAERGVRFPVFAVWPEGGTSVFERLDDVVGANREFYPSRDIRHAMEAFEKIKRKKYKIRIEYTDDGDWTVRVGAGDKHVEETDSSLPLAVSKAVLGAVRKVGQ